MAGDWQRWWGFAARALRHAVGRALIFLILLTLDPFGMIEWGDIRTRALWQHIYADQYGREASNNLVTVVELDDASLTSAAPADTLPDSIHLLDIFKTLNNGIETGGTGTAPRAIFIDILLGDLAPDLTQLELLEFDPALRSQCPLALRDDLTYEAAAGLSPFRCMLLGIAEMTKYEDWRKTKACLTGNALVKLNCIVMNGGTPVFIADSTDPAERRAGVTKPGAAALASVGIATPVLVKERSYPLVHPASAVARANNLYELYPAAALYAVHCRVTGSCKPNPIVKPDAQQARRTGASWKATYWGWSEAFDAPVEVNWGVGGESRFTTMVDSMASGTLDQRCRVADRSAWAPFRAFTYALFSGLELSRPTCPYQRSVSYSLLKMGGNRPDLLPGFRKEALAGKIVMLGMSTKDSNDFIEAGPHGQLPGIYYHAMALDNLLNGGEKYPKAPRVIFPFLALSSQDLLNTMAAFLMLLYGGAFLAWNEQRLQSRKSLRNKHIHINIAMWLAGAIAWVFVVLYLLTGQIGLVLSDFNFAALSIVVAIQLYKIVTALLNPILERLAETNRVVGFLWGRARPLPRKRGKSAQEGANADIISPASRRRAAGDAVQSIPPDAV